MSCVISQEGIKLLSGQGSAGHGMKRGFQYAVLLVPSHFRKNQPGRSIGNGGKGIHVALPVRDVNTVVMSYRFCIAVETEFILGKG
jgi:hypothetical protein